MIDVNRLKNPKLSIPLSMMFLVTALVWPAHLHLAANLSPNWTDGLRGLLFGISIGIGLVSAILAARQRRRVGH
jgi:UDP-N-acetylmuramyl pentapeptide phosphotransferase/UDP-N-acetylglucosamine-1-phosphate transferase